MPHEAGVVRENQRLAALKECSLTCRNYGYTKNVTSLSVWQSNYIDLGTMRFPWLYLISCNRKFPIFTRPRLKHLQSKIIWYLLLSLSKYKHVLRKMGSRQEMASTLGSQQPRPRRGKILDTQIIRNTPTRVGGHYARGQENCQLNCRWGWQEVKGRSRVFLPWRRRWLVTQSKTENSYNMLFCINGTLWWKLRLNNYFMKKQYEECLGKYIVFEPTNKC